MIIFQYNTNNFYTHIAIQLSLAFYESSMVQPPIYLSPNCLTLKFAYLFLNELALVAATTLHWFKKFLCFFFSCSLTGV